MQLGMSDRVLPLVESVRKFIKERVVPVDGEFLREVEKRRPLDPDRSTG